MTMTIGGPCQCGQITNEPCTGEGEGATATHWITFVPGQHQGTATTLRSWWGLSQTIAVSAGCGEWLVNYAAERAAELDQDPWVIWDDDEPYDEPYDDFPAFGNHDDDDGDGCVDGCDECDVRDVCCDYHDDYHDDDDDDSNGERDVAAEWAGMELPE